MNQTSTKLSSNSRTEVSATNKPVLLLVDDEERILRSLRMLFARDYNVIVTTDAHVALNTLKQQKVHVIISDQRMPEMTGVELLRNARKISPDTMRILLTGYADLSAIVGSINESEVFRFINKPWDSEELRKTVTLAMSIALTANVEEMNATVLEFPANHTLSKPAHTQQVMKEGTILLVDSSAAVIAELTAIVEEMPNAKYRAVAATTLDGALSLIEKHDISLMLSDVMLGGQDVKPLIATLKEHRPQVVTIVLSSMQGAGMLAQLINQGQIYRYLSKPLRRALVERAIENGMDQHLSLRNSQQLRARHIVEPTVQSEDAPLVARLKGFFSRLRKS